MSYQKSNPNVKIISRIGESNGNVLSEHNINLKSIEHVGINQQSTIPVIKSEIKSEIKQEINYVRPQVRYIAPSQSKYIPQSQSKYIPQSQIKYIPTSQSKYIMPPINTSYMSMPIQHVSSYNYNTRIPPVVIAPIPSYDIVLREILTLDKMNPVLCEHMYTILFNNNNEECKNDNNENENENIDYSVYFKEYIRSLKFDKFITILQISSTFDRYTQLFINDNTTKIIDNIDNIDKSDKVDHVSKFVDQIVDQKTDLSIKYDISDKNNANTIISISKQNFLELSLETYPDDVSIIRQCLLDLPRQDVYINGTFITDIDQMLHLLGDFNKELKINTKGRNTISTTMLAIALICQSSFFMSFLHLHNKCTKMHSSITENIAEDPKCIKENEIRLNTHVCDMNERHVVTFYISHDSFKCSFSAKYRVVDVLAVETLYAVKTEILIDIFTDTGLIVYDVM